jgi:transposase
MPRAAEIPLPVRASILTLKSPHCGKSSAAIHEITGVSISRINRIYGKAIERGFELHVIPLVILNEHLVDACRSGRPTKQTPEIREIVISKVTKDQYDRELSCADLAALFSQLGIEISGSTIRRILKNARFRKTKPTRKPGLTKKMKKERLEWCLQHKDCVNTKTGLSRTGRTLSGLTRPQSSCVRRGG